MQPISERPVRRHGSHISWLAVSQLCFSPDVKIVPAERLEGTLNADSRRAPAVT